MDFSTAPTQQFGTGELIPKGTLAWAWLTLRPYNMDQGIAETPSKSSEARYLDVEMTIEGGPYDRRKLWDKIGVCGSEKYVQAGHAAIRHILEVGKEAGPQNMAGYVIDNYFAIDGLKVAIEIGIEKGSQQYPEDKNNVRYLSPNPESDTHKKFQRLVNGDTAPPQTAATAPAAAGPSWGGAVPATSSGGISGPSGAPAATAKPSWL